MKFNKNPQELIEPVSRLWANRKDFMEEVAREMAAETKKRILKTKTDPDGKKWKPWANSTKIARQKEGTAGKGLLNRRGSLLNSIKYKASEEKLIVYTEVPYAKYLQLGTKNMPARRFIGTGVNEERAMRRIWKGWINQ